MLSRLIFFVYWIVLCLSIDSTFPSLGTTETSSESSSEDSSEDSSEECYNNWKVNYVDSSTEFRIYNPCYDDQSLAIEMLSLIEYDSKNVPTSNSISSFASEDWNWIHGEMGQDTEYEGYSVISNRFEANDIIGEAVDFALETIFFKEDALIMNHTTLVERGSLKWNVDTANWPFINVNNTLKLCVNITTNNANKDSSDSDSDSGSSDSSSDSSDNDTHTDSKLWNIGDFGLHTLNYAECGGLDKISVTVEDKRISNSSTERNVCFSFEYCESGNIDYDPVVKYSRVDDETSSSGLTSAEQAGIVIGIVVILMIIAVSGIYYIIKKKRREKYPSLLETAEIVTVESQSTDQTKQ